MKTKAKENINLLEERQKHLKQIPLIISLLLHLLFLILIAPQIFYNKERISFPSQPHIILRPRPEPMPAALFPKKSIGGTKIYSDETSGESLTEEPNEKPIEKITETISERAIPKEAKKEVLPEEKTSSQEQKEKQEQKEEPTQKEILKPEPKAKTTYIPNLEQLALNNMVQPQNNLKQIEQAEQKNEPSKKKSLLSLADCFLDHEKGNSCLFKFGENRKPTSEEMKFYCYEQQIEQHTRSNWRIIAGSIPPEKLQAPRPLSFEYVINEHGEAEEVKVIRSSGNSFFDSLVIKTIQKTQFPPIPKHFGVKRYRPQGGYVLLR